LFSEGCSEEVLVGDMWSDILFGTQLSCLGEHDEPLFELGSKDAFR